MDIYGKVKVVIRDRRVNDGCIEVGNDGAKERESSNEVQNNINGIEVGIRDRHVNGHAGAAEAKSERPPPRYLYDIDGEEGILDPCSIMIGRGGSSPGFVGAGYMHRCMHEFV